MKYPLAALSLGLSMCALAWAPNTALGAANAPSVPDVPNMPNGHPILGTWHFTLPNSQCTETYFYKPDGTALVTSGEEVGETTFEVSAEVSPKGFFKIVDKIVKDNGKKDCSGAVMTVGHEATNYVTIHPSGELMLMCESESLQACFGPLRRAHGIPL